MTKNNYNKVLHKLEVAIIIIFAKTCQ